MIKKCFYSTLCKQCFEKKSDAQKAEDKYVSNYFKQLKSNAIKKRNQLKQLEALTNVK